MKKLLVTGLAVTLLTISSIGFAAPTPTSQAEQPPSFTMPKEIINGIAVPYEILLDTQMAFQGCAVTGASKSSRSGREVYVLRLDGTENGKHCSSLLFDMNWRYIAKESYVAPRPVVTEPRPEAPANDPPQAEEQSPAGPQEHEDEEDEPEEEPEPVRPIRRNRRAE